MIEAPLAATLQAVPRASIFVTVLWFLGGAGCVPGRAASHLSSPEVDPLPLSIEARLASLPEADRCRNLRSAHRAYRLLAETSAALACETLGAEQDSFVQLHGDLHLEQLAHADGVTGFTDLDEAAEGPAWVDLLRFTVSMRLATRGHRWPSTVGRLAQRRFLDAYLNLLATPLDGDEPLPAPLPDAVARRLAARANRDPEAASEALSRSVHPLPSEESEAFRRAWYEATRSEPRPIRPLRFGRIEVGVGSAHLDKILVQIAPTSQGAPPRWLEAKETPPSALRRCTGSGAARADRVLRALHTMAPHHRPAFLLRHRDRLYTVHPWALSYAELSPSEDLLTPSELIETATRAGRWLATVHARSHPSPQRLARRITRRRRALERLVQRLLDASWTAWRQARLRFCQGAATGSGEPSPATDKASGGPPGSSSS